MFLLYLGIAYTFISSIPGRTVILECHAYAEVKWIRERDEMAANTVQERITDDFNYYNTLKIHNATQTNSGQYYCLAEESTYLTVVGRCIYLLVESSVSYLGGGVDEFSGTFRK